MKISSYAPLPNDKNVDISAEVFAICRLAKEREDAGDFEGAGVALAQYWSKIGSRPRTEGLDKRAAAELILRAGSLSGSIGSARQVPGAQESAKDLISEAIHCFTSLQIPEKIAEAQVDLAVCYWREGALDEARVTLREALEQLGELHTEQRTRALINSAIIESASGRYYDALNILTRASHLVHESSDHQLKGKFHNEFATVLAHLGKAELRADYLDRALVEYTAASFDFEKAGNKRSHATVENNLGLLFLTSYRTEEAYTHLNRARAAFEELKDKGSIALVDDSRARALLADKRYREAERLAASAVGIRQQGDEVSMLAEALMTKGIAQARLGEYSKAQTTLLLSMEVFEEGGSREGAGRVALTMIEELATVITKQELGRYFKRATDALAHSQQLETLTRLVKCSRSILDSELSICPRALRVFLCHSKADKPHVRELRDRLRSENFDPWIDEEKLLAGQDWDSEISKAVRSSDVVIVCLSQSSTSRAGFVQKEIKYALDVADQQPEGTIFLIPLKLEECAVPERLSRWQWVDLFEISGFTRLMNSLHKRELDLYESS